MQNNKIFFVITCVKNGHDLIWPLFESMINQTNHNFVHYIYDDGSDKPVEDLVEKYKELTSKLECPHEIIYERNNKNIGLNTSTINAIKKCNLPYFTWINCDDKVKNNFFEEMTKAISKNKNAVVFRSNQIVLKNNQIISIKEDTRRKYLKNTFQLPQYLYRYYFWSTFVVKTDAYKSINPNYYFDNNPLVFNDRQVLFALVNMENPKFVFVKNAFSYYVIRNDSEGHKCDEYLESDFYNKNSLYYSNLIDNLFPNKKVFYESFDNYRLLSKKFFAAYRNNDFKQMKKDAKTKNQFAKENKIPNNLKYYKHKDLYYFVACIIKKIKLLFTKN